MFSYFFFLCYFVTFLKANIYLHSIRGSNNRLNEANRGRNNGDRLFNSQNNERGGYNIGKLTFYSGETVPISWTNSHSSGNYQLKHSEIIIQYMCNSLMRDGTTTSQIPRTNYNYQCSNYDCESDVSYGRHESYFYYQQCRAHERNRGLFTANQNFIYKDGCIYTRQNPNGIRRGYECDEERDYYPYWRPSPWRDIVIYTNQIERCDKYKQESQNVKEKYECRFTDEYWTDIKGEFANGDGEIPMNHTICQRNYQYIYGNKSYVKWYLHTEKSHGIEEPECLESKITRANHHGTYGNREFWTYYWTVPNLSKDKYYTSEDYSTCCVIRLRYNITTGDYKAWESDSSINPGLDYRNNTKNDPSPDSDINPAWVKIWEKFGLDYWDVYQSFDGNRDGDPQRKSRGYVFIDNPRVDPFGHIFNYTGGSSRIQVQLAIDTTQFGRTFEDRSHCFSIKDKYTGNNTYLFTVQGKRGNIVQVFPATQYYFVPDPLEVKVNDYVHFCWTGSNNNPSDNDGQGVIGSDRSNICPLANKKYDKSLYSDIDNNELNRINGAIGDLGNNYPNYVNEPFDEVNNNLPYFYKRNYTFGNEMAGFDVDILTELCMPNSGGPELDNSNTNFCIEPQRVTKEGRWNFLSTRNNNFGNRFQKGTLIVNGNSTNDLDSSKKSNNNSSIIYIIIISILSALLLISVIVIICGYYYYYVNKKKTEENDIISEIQLDVKDSNVANNT